MKGEYIALIIICIILLLIVFTFNPSIKRPRRLHRRRVVLSDYRVMVIQGDVKKGDIILLDNVPMGTAINVRTLHDCTVCVMSNPINVAPQYVDIVTK